MKYISIGTYKNDNLFCQIDGTGCSIRVVRKNTCDLIADINSIRHRLAKLADALCIGFVRSIERGIVAYDTNGNLTVNANYGSEQCR